MVFIPENQCSGLRSPPLPISEAQMCHQCVIEHTSSPEAAGPPPLPPSCRMRGRRVAFPPILWNGAENRRKRDTPHSVYQSWVCSADLWNFISMPSSICQWIGKEVKKEGVVLEPAANLPSLLRCIIQCFSHNSLRFEGLSSPSHAAGSLLIWKKLRIHSVVPSGFLALHSQSYLYDLFSLFIHGVRLGPQWTSWGNIFVLVRIHPQNLAEEVCRHRYGLSEWHWSSLTSHWWLVWLLLQRVSLLSQCTETRPWPQSATEGESVEDKSTGWLPAPPNTLHFCFSHWKFTEKSLPCNFIIVYFMCPITFTIFTRLVPIQWIGIVVFSHIHTLRWN